MCALFITISNIKQLAVLFVYIEILMSESKADLDSGFLIIKYKVTKQGEFKMYIF